MKTKKEINILRKSISNNIDSKWLGNVINKLIELELKLSTTEKDKEYLKLGIKFNGVLLEKNRLKFENTTLKKENIELKANCLRLKTYKRLSK